MNKNVSKKIAATMLLGTMIAYTLPISAFTKDETVYTNTKPDGEKYQTIVTEHLINEQDEELLKDLTNLLNIENTSGDEEFTQDGESLVWDAKTEDIYYKGEIDQELPIKISVKYELDEKEISSEEIAGKSGHVKVTINFENTDSHEVKINGKTETMYTPFIIAAGTYINNETAKNIKVQNGKLIDDGSKSMVVGLTFPGMQQSLKINESTIEIPDSIQIEFDTENFEMNNIISYATPRIIEDEELDIFGKLDEIYSKVETLKSAADQIEQGANTLSEGTTTYVEKSTEFNQAINQFTNGVSTATESYKKLDNGINTLNNQVSTLQNGTKQVSDGLEQVSNGVSQIQSSLSSSSSNIQALVSGAKQVSNGLTSLNQAVEVPDYTEKKTELNTLIAYNTQAINTLDQTYTELATLLSTEELSDTAKQVIQNELVANRTSKANLEKDIQALNQTLATLDTSVAQMTTLKQNITALDQGSSQVSEGVNQVAQSLGTLSQGINTLSSSTNQLSNGAKQIYNGTISLAQGTQELSQGSNQMKTGLETINSSASQLNDANNQLLEGAKTIQDGASQLAEGTKEFNNSGITLIYNYVNGDIKNIATRAEKLQELSKQYNTFTKINEEQSQGKVKFITIVDSIKTNDKNKGQEEKDEKTSK